MSRFRPLALVALLVVAGACDQTKSPTEPMSVTTPVPTPVPLKTWTGTFTGASVQCNSNASIVYDAGGPLPTEANVPCLNGGYRILLSLARQGNAITGYALWGDPEFYPVTGTLTDSAMDLTIFNDTVDFPMGPTGPMGTIHLHP